MDMVFDWNLGNKIHRSLNTLRLYGFPFVEIEVVSILILGPDAGNPKPPDPSMAYFYFLVARLRGIIGTLMPLASPM
jgi:hypothetical protein